MSRASKFEMTAPRAANAMTSERSRFFRPEKWAIAGAAVVAPAAVVTALLRHPAARPPVVSATLDALSPTAPAAAAAAAVPKHRARNAAASVRAAIAERRFSAAGDGVGAQTLLASAAQPGIAYRIPN